MSDGRATQNQGDQHVVNQTANLRSYGQCAVCSCGKIGYTNAVQSCNVLNIIFCCCLPNCWYCYQIFKKKDLNCYDAVHTCSTCNKELAHYTAC